MKKHIYISGPISNKDPVQVQINLQKFHAKAEELRSQGHTVINPAEKDEEGDTGITWEDYMRLDIPLLLKCNTIHLLPGWQASRGALLELHIARELSMNVEGHNPVDGSTS